jgi:hypothetical protein
MLNNVMKEEEEDGEERHVMFGDTEYATWQGEVIDVGEADRVGETRVSAWCARQGE